MRISASRILIEREYNRLMSEDVAGRVDVVRTISKRLGYTIDENGSNSFVRRVIQTLTAQ